MQMPEEETFAVLVKLMQDYRMREMFKPSMAELGLCMYQLEVLGMVSDNFSISMDFGHWHSLVGDHFFFCEKLHHS